MVATKDSTRTREAVSNGSRGSRLRVLLTNGRFPAAIDMARQLRRAGHTVYVVDTMSSHVCKFSMAVRRSKTVPKPHEDPAGYIREIKAKIAKWRIDLVIPVYEEIFYLADSDEPEIVDRLFAPDFELLVRLHDKWEFNQLLKRCGLDAPKATLCKSMEDVQRLKVSKYQDGIILKPCFGRGLDGVHHLKSDEPSMMHIDIGAHNWHIAEEGTTGTRYRSYSVVQQGKVMATGVYRVPDDSSVVRYEQEFHAGIYSYIERLVSQLGDFSGQLAFNFVECGERLVAIDCIPRATSGLHLWNSTSKLAQAITNTLPSNTKLPLLPPKTRSGNQPRAQATPPMLRWEHRDATVGAYTRHMSRLIASPGSLFTFRDFFPSIAQPFLLTSYYAKSHEYNLSLPEFFQEDTFWEPSWDAHDPEGCQLGDIRALMRQSDISDDMSGTLARGRLSSSSTSSDITLCVRDASVESRQPRRPFRASSDIALSKMPETPLIERTSSSLSTSTHDIQTARARALGAVTPRSATMPNFLSDRRGSARLSQQSFAEFQANRDVRNNMGTPPPLYDRGASSSFTRALDNTALVPAGVTAVSPAHRRSASTSSRLSQQTLCEVSTAQTVVLPKSRSMPFALVVTPKQTKASERVPTTRMSQRTFREGGKMRGSGIEFGQTAAVVAV